MDEGIVLREKEKSLHISRLPKKVKEEFVQVAEEEFAGDYGMLLRELWERNKELMAYYTNYDLKLNYIIELLEKDRPVFTEQKESPRKTLGGREIKGGGK